MITKHLSEQQIQAYVLDETRCETQFMEHIGSCPNCQAKAANYRLIFSTMAQQPQPTFDFDIAGLVLARIPETKPAAAWKDKISYVTAFTALAFMGLPAYICREYLSQLFTDMPSLTVYALATGTLFIVLFQGVELYRKYERRMNILNY